MRALIISDTHGKQRHYLELLKKQPQWDAIFHCGDFEGGEHSIVSAAPCRVHMVRGNNDFGGELPKEMVVFFGPYKIWLTHGHTYYPGSGLEMLASAARARGVDVVMFGHTHRPVLDQSYAGLTMINPGSISYPRQENGRPSYGIMELDKEEGLHFTLAYI